jgi:cell filamentation protein
MLMVKKSSKQYQTSHLIEDQYEPGSRGRVLKNLVGISRKREMDLIEAKALFSAHEELVTRLSAGHRFKASDICRIHSDWLGKIYPWAGNYRQVQISKAGFPFAAPRQIPQLMHELELGYLKTFTPCRAWSDEQTAKALATVHAELLLIHPFRDGNGRMARLLATLMALQADYPPLGFAGIVGRKKREYIAAIHAAMDRDYEPMERVFISVLRRTLRIYGTRWLLISIGCCRKSGTSRALLRSRSM